MGKINALKRMASLNKNLMRKTLAKRMAHLFNLTLNKVNARFADAFSKSVLKRKECHDAKLQVLNLKVKREADEEPETKPVFESNYKWNAIEDWMSTMLKNKDWRAGIEKSIVTPIPTTLSTSNSFEERARRNARVNARNTYNRFTTEERWSP